VSRPDFDGSDYVRAYDVVRLTNQLEKIVEVMSDEGWYTHGEIEDATGAPGASVGAQLANLRKKRYGAYPVPKRLRGAREDGLWEYSLGEQGSHTPRKPAVLLRAEAAERFADELADALEEVRPGHPLLEAWDAHRHT